MKSARTFGKIIQPITSARITKEDSEFYTYEIDESKPKESAKRFVSNKKSPRKPETCHM